MRPWLIVALVLLAACGGGDDAAPVEATVTTQDPVVARYCRIMERTDEDYRSGDLVRQGVGEQMRIVNAPDELEGAYASGNVEAVKDWTQRHCGFLPTFDL